ncbi:flagellar M-ring protein FliF [Sphingomonas sp. SORGH_AS802]|uniref:flagellar basal-body MS-ring/collar protein FliF n=1 Tax=unclassified Sphingomonas TaxID=196159 RepID=UPI00285905A5|nr:MULTISPECIES: flagellar basal-body MS-ring/collar protein FliF [unclassified Sphingomonas]MDR6128835.1 flagellar M-ring protein FliF [Sphingomonas sp. SORGH_AS_0438]MDR6136152.1 flagellar M-ring protein FliF [Sphingomonas sp. SORGH_AS_0802]
MSNALTTTAPAVPERFANPLRQIRGVMAQPAVRRSAPMAMLVGLIGAAGLAYASLSTPPQKTLFANLADADKAAVMASLQQADIGAHVDDATGAVTVNEDQYSRARMLLASQNLPKAAPGGYAILDQLPMGVSRAVEGERLRQARESELARSIQEIDAVAEARVHLAMPEATVFVRDHAEPSASVVVKLNAGRALSDAQVSSIVNLVASSVPGMKPDAVTIVDQAGALLTRPGGRDGLGKAGDERLDVQNRVEDKVRQQLTQLLTPLLGAGNFSAEVQADVNLDETQATRESYEKQGALRAETGQWTGNQGGAGAPGGIPGALSNTPPPASTLQVPTPAVGASGSPQPQAGAAPPDPAKQSDSYQRAYDLGREVSVTRGAPGSIKRLSVAVLLRDPATGKRTAMEINQITDLVKSAVGFDANRQDQVTVISRKFAGASDAVDTSKWYDNAWLPVLARNGTAIVIALLVLLLGVRPLAKALMKKKDEAEAPVPGSAPALGTGGAGVGADGIAVSPPVSLDQLETARGYDERISAVRGFTRDNPARAALAVRDMIRTDGQ